MLAATMLAIFIIGAMNTVTPGPYNYDEADYMFAVSQGARANWWDASALGLGEFIRAGLQRSHDPAEDLALSQTIRQSGDTLFYRHWHGPLYYFWLIGLSSFHGDEYWMRVATLTFPAITGLILYFGLLWIIPEVSVRDQAAIFAAVLFWGSYAVILSTEIAPHQMFVMWTVLALLFIAKSRVDGQRDWVYGAVVTTALAFATLEVAFVVGLVLAGYLWLERERLHVDLQFIVRLSSLFLATLLLVWPAAILKLSFVKAYAFMAYLALVRERAWGDSSVLETWLSRFQQAPFEWALLPIAVVAFWKYRSRAANKSASVFLIFALVMVIAMLRVNGALPRYALPFMPAFDAFVAIALATALASYSFSLRISVLLLACVIRLADTTRGIDKRMKAADPRPVAVLAEIHKRGLESQRLLVPQDDLPVLHYYFPKARLTGYRAAVFASTGFDAALHTGFPVIVTAAGEDELTKTK